MLDWSTSPFRQAGASVFTPRRTFHFDGPVSRLLIPALFAVVGVGTVVWNLLNAPPQSGWQAYVPHAVGASFVIFGVGAVARELERRKDRRADLQALEEHRDAPWLVRPAWRTRELIATERPNRSLLPLAIFWNVVSWPLAFVILMAESGSGDPGVWLVLLFPVVGLGLLAPIILGYLRRRKFARTVVALDRVPMRLGEPCVGVLRITAPPDARPERGVLVKASCYRQRVRYVRDSDGDRSRKIERDLLWRDEKRFEVRAGWGGRAIEVPFAFDLPSDPPASTPLELANRILWELSAEAEVPGLDFRARVEIPVFPPDADREAHGHVEPAPDADASGRLEAGSGAEAAGGVAPVSLDEPAVEWAFDEPLSDGIRVIDEPDLFEVHFTAARKRGAAVVLGVLGTVFLLVGALTTPGAVLVGLIFVAAGGLLIFGSFQQGTNDTLLSVEGGRVAVRHDGIGMPEDVEIPVGRVTDVVVHLGGSSSSDNATYSISLLAQPGDGLEHVEEQMENVMNLMSRFGVGDAHPAMDALRDAAEQPKIAVADSFSEKAEADWLASKIREALAGRSGRGGV